MIEIHVRPGTRGDDQSRPRVRIEIAADRSVAIAVSQEPAALPPATAVSESPRLGTPVGALAQTPPALPAPARQSDVPPPSRELLEIWDDVLGEHVDDLRDDFDVGF